jgi:hypothetical protein
VLPRFQPGYISGAISVAVGNAALVCIVNSWNSKIAENNLIIFIVYNSYVPIVFVLSSLLLVFLKNYCKFTQKSLSQEEKIVFRGEFMFLSV